MSWEIKEHTKAKHTVLRNYLAAWFPIMAFTNPKIVYIDGFAGPGKYKNGEDGSPIYALKIAKEIYENHQSRLKTKQFVFFFIESKKSHFLSLKDEIQKLTLPENFQVEVIHGEFADTMTDVFTYFDENSFSLAPTFAFIDPFGTKGVPFDLIKKIMSFRKCEVFFNHMYSGVIRSRDVTDHTELYGTDTWKYYAEDYVSLTQLYKDQLLVDAGVSYTRSFNVRNRNNAHIFDLVYATNNKVGLDKMKSAMWKADPSGNFTFRDTTDPNQIVLFELEPDISPLKNLILDRFKYQVVEICDIEDFVLLETPFLSSHIRRKTLSPLEKKGKIIVKRPPGSKSGFKEGTAIKFF